MKKRFFLLATLLLTFSVITACGTSTPENTPTPQSQSQAPTVQPTKAPAQAPTATQAPAPTKVKPTATTPAEPITLTFWNYWDGKNGEVIQSLVDEYNKAHPNVTINNVFIGWGELLPKLQTAAAGGTMPDLAAVDLVWVPKLVDTGKPVALNDYIAASNVNLKDFYASQLDVDRYGDTYYSLPVSTNNLELFYNKDMFRAAGLDPDKPPTTWSELADYATKLTKPDGSQYGMELFT